MSHKIVKRPTDTRPIIINAANNLPNIIPKPQIASVVVTAKDSVGTDITNSIIKSGSVGFEDYRIEAWITGGANGLIGTITFLITLDDENETELTEVFKLYVRDQ